MKQTFFIKGIVTDVGKTLVSAILVEALQADYCKPIQEGELDNSDTKKVKYLISNSKTRFHQSAFELNTPASPHAAAKIDGKTISVDKIKRPETKNNLVIEGAGGLLVPLNTKNTLLDLIEHTDTVIVVSRHYLGSINHTLLTIEHLKQHNFNNISIVFSGNENPSTENIIKTMTKVKILGRIDNEPYFDKNVVLEYAEQFKNELTRKR